MTSQTTKTNRNYYAAHSYMGLDYGFYAMCWKALKFSSKLARDAWVDKYAYSHKTNQYVARAITANDYAKIKNKIDYCPFTGLVL